MTPSLPTWRHRAADRLLGLTWPVIAIFDLFFGRYFEERSGLRRARQRAKEAEGRGLKVNKGGQP
jgi:hypothetical protein